MKTKHAILIIFSLLFVFGITNQAIGQQDHTLKELIEKARDQGIQASSLNDLVRRSESQAISDEQLFDILEKALTMAEQNLPTEAALGKALEGISKNIPADRVQTVLDDYVSSTRRSSEMVDPWLEDKSMKDFAESANSKSSESFRNDLIQAVARGLRKGVSTETFHSILNEISGNNQILSKTTPDRVIAGVAVIPELPGTAAEQAHIARSIIIKALQSNFTPMDLQQLPGALHQAQQRSQLPASSILAGLSKQIGAGIGPSQVLRNLFNGNIGAGPPGDIPNGIGGKPGFVNTGIGS